MLFFVRLSMGFAWFCLIFEFHFKQAFLIVGFYFLSIWYFSSFCLFGRVWIFFEGHFGDYVLCVLIFSGVLKQIQVD